MAFLQNIQLTLGQKNYCCKNNLFIQGNLLKNEVPAHQRKKHFPAAVPPDFLKKFLPDDKHRFTESR